MVQEHLLVALADPVDLAALEVLEAQRDLVVLADLVEPEVLEEQVALVVSAAAVVAAVVVELPQVKALQLILMVAVAVVALERLEVTAVHLMDQAQFLAVVVQLMLAVPEETAATHRLLH
jgi:hypothetical protein